MRGFSTLGQALRRVAAATLVCSLALLALAAGGTAASDTNVMIVYRAYQPAEMTVLAGQTVTWRNSGLGPHTVTADAGQFDSGVLQTGGTFSYTFTTAGVFAYSCTIHPTMHGKVVVLAALPPGFPPGAALDAVLLHFSKQHTAHGGLRLVHVQAARPAAKALLQVQSPSGSSWSTKLRTQLSSAGTATFRLSASVRRRVRVVVEGPAGEAPLISKPARPPA